MEPLQRADNVPLTDAQYRELRKLFTDKGIPGEVADAELEKSQNQEVWKNDLYTVHVNRDGPGQVHLSIKRNDRAPCRDWRHFQQIKNEICGTDWEGVELYPAERRVVDSANQYHLWCMNREIPVGFPEGFRCDKPVGGAKQRRGA